MLPSDGTGSPPSVPLPATSASATSAAPQTNGTVNHPQNRHVWVFTGPAGCGKSTVAKYLAAQFSLPYIEGDEFHPKANIDKMAAGIPLDDTDRWDWLILLRDQCLAELETGASAVIMTCSALKQKYRDVLRTAAYYGDHVVMHFVYLRATKELILARVKARQGHYMKDSMVESQFKSLEEPTAVEMQRDVVAIEANASLAVVQQQALDIIKQLVASEPAVVVA